MKLENGIWVAVCDGGKFLLLKNRGDTDMMDLRVIAHEEIDRDAQIGRETRGPSPDGPQAKKGRSQNLSVEELSEQRFVNSVGAELDERVQSGAIDKIVLIADPRTLGRLRSRMNEQTREAIIEEIGGDFAHNTVADVEAVLVRHVID
ncbi:MAG: host attachment protein [Pseudomonadota bacterium]